MGKSEEPAKTPFQHKAEAARHDLNYRDRLNETRRSLHRPHRQFTGSPFLDKLHTTYEAHEKLSKK